jgi:hypothetical protein
VIPSGDRPERIELACEAHHPGGEWWLLTGLDDIDGALLNAAALDGMRPGILYALTALHRDLMTREVEIPCTRRATSWQARRPRGPTRP